MTTRRLIRYVPAVMIILLGGFICEVSAAQRYWAIHELLVPYGLMAMRGGDTWPVVTAFFGDETFFMGPTGYVASGPGGTDIAAGPNGEIAVVGSKSVHVLRNGAWSALPGSAGGYQVRAVAFDPQGNLAAAISHPTTMHVQYGIFNGTTWMASDTGLYGPYPKIAMDASGVATIGGSDGKVASHLPGNPGSWMVEQVYSPWGTADVAVSDAGVPAVLMGGTVYVFDVQSQGWMSSIAVGYGALEFDQLGNLGVAYWNPASYEMNYAYNDGSGTGWELSYIGQTAAWPSATVSLAYDAQNNPVACFGGAGQTFVAYDPLIVPEPVTGVTLAAGVFLGWCTRRRRG